MGVIKTADLIGPALDWAVAKAEDWLKYITFDFESTHPLVLSRVQAWGPSFIWSQGGPIIEREYIDIEYFPGGAMWQAQACLQDEYCQQHGSTLLVAAMRCFVASRLGDQVDVPAELM